MLTKEPALAYPLKSGARKRGHMVRRPDFSGLVADLRELGVRPGQHLLVHSSLRSIGSVEGGAPAVLDALCEVVGRATIVVPTFTARNSVSSAAFRKETKGLSGAALDRYQASMPGFDPATTPSEDMGRLAEYVRTRPESVRSRHPQTSFAAFGPSAAECVRDHALDCRFGASSPLGWLCRHDAAVLLLGVGYDACSAFHLAEYGLSNDYPRRAYHCYVMTAGERRDCELWDVDLDDSDFAALGQRMDGEPFVRRGLVGAAECRLVPIKRAVDFAGSDRAFRHRRMPAADGLASSPGWQAVRTDMTTRGSTDLPGRYFFLSYPRLPPVPPVRGADLTDPPDEGMRAFFGDLSAEVRRRAASRSLLRSGFLDIEADTSRHWNSGLADAIGSAEVFVPLLSPDYYRRSWPRSEWASFLQRLRDMGVAEPLRRFAPVLWAPLSAGEQAPGLADALSLASGAALAPYREYGLGTLRRQPSYRRFYAEVVGELATRIVALAEKAPLGPSPARIRKVTEPFSEGTGGKVFVITVTGGQGSLEVAAQITEYARLAAERLGFAVHIVELTTSARPIGQAPGVLLVHPGAADGEAAVADLDARILGLPSWVLPVVVADWTAAHPVGETKILLSKSHKSYNRKPEIMRRALGGVTSLQEFVALMPFLVAQAEREYLRHGPIQRSASRPASRPRLAGSGSPADPPGKENPDV
jgi:aminoglycoside 3-N-acetyltransferase